jgi:hypothetical protein
MRDKMTDHMTLSVYLYYIIMNEQGQYLITFVSSA